MTSPATAITATTLAAVRCLEIADTPASISNVKRESMTTRPTFFVKPEAGTTKIITSRRIKRIESPRSVSQKRRKGFCILTIPGHFPPGGCGILIRQHYEGG